MKHIRDLISTTQALRQIFFVPREVPRARFLRYLPAQTLSQFRSFHSSGARAIQRTQLPAKTDHIRDESIRAEYIQMVNEDGKLDQPVRLRDVLRSFDRSENFLLQVSPGSRDRPPVCKIVNRVALREQERAQSKAAHAAKKSVKQIELNWAIDPHDLSHRLKQLTDFLDKGRKVEIVLTRKRRKRAPTVEEIKNVMEKVLQTTKDADATQIKPMEGEPGKHLVLVVKKKDA